MVALELAKCRAVARTGFCHRNRTHKLAVGIVGESDHDGSAGIDQISSEQPLPASGGNAVAERHEARSIRHQKIGEGAGGVLRVVTAVAAVQPTSEYLNGLAVEMPQAVERRAAVWRTISSSRRYDNRAWRDGAVEVAGSIERCEFVQRIGNDLDMTHVGGVVIRRHC